MKKLNYIILAILMVLLTVIAVFADNGVYTNTKYNNNSIYELKDVNASYVRTGNLSVTDLILGTTNSSLYWAGYSSVNQLNYLILSYWTNITDRPTALSEFTNDVDYITNATMNRSIVCSDIDGATSDLCTIVPDVTTPSQVVTWVGNFSAWDYDFGDMINTPNYLSNFTNDVDYITNETMNRSIVCSDIDGASSNLCTIVDTTYSALSEFTNDVNYITNATMNRSIVCSDIDGATSDLCTIVPDVTTPAQVVDWVGNFSDWDKDYGDLINSPTALSEFTNDVNYITNATMNRSLNCDEINGATSDLCTIVDTTYSALSEFTNDVNYITNATMNRSIVCSDIDGATSDLCTIVDTTYTALSEFDNDEGFYNTKANLTTLLDGDYLAIGDKYTDAEAVSAVATADVYVKNDGDTITGLLTIDQNSDLQGLNIDSEATNAYGIYVDTAGAPAGYFGQSANNYVILAANAAAYTNRFKQAASLSGPLVYIDLDYSSTSNDALKIKNSGTGKGILLDQDGNAIAMDIDSESATYSAINIQDTPSNKATTIAENDKHCLNVGCTSYIVNNGTGVVIK